MSAQDISAAFLSARRRGVALDAYPGTVPPSLEEAYTVQQISTDNWGEPIAGYKVGGIGPEWRDQYPSTRLAGPVFSSLVYVADADEITDIPVFQGGFAAYEPELIFRLKNLDRPREQITSIEQAKPYIDSVYLGAEIASSPLATLNDLGPGSIISDFGNQAGIIIGQKIDRDWIDRLSEISVETVIDGHTVGDCCVNDSDDGPLGALLFLLNHLRDNPPSGNGVAETWLSSGAITGVHKSSVGSSCTIRYRGLGALKIAMIARKTETSA